MLQIQSPNEPSNSTPLALQIPDMRAWWCNSDPHREMAYTVTPAGDVRYPGCAFDRTLALLERMRNNPPILTPPISHRKIQTQGSGLKKVRPRRVSLAELDWEYGRYVSGELGFNAIWETLFLYVSHKSSVEENDFGFRNRQLTGDSVADFMLSMRSGILAKSYVGKGGSSFHNYVNRAWFQFKCKVSAKLCKHDDLFVSEGEGKELDEEGRRLSLFDTARMDAWNSNPKTVEGTLRALVEVSRLNLSDLEVTILEDMQAGVDQLVTAEKLDKSRYAIARAQAKIIDGMKKALPSIHARSYKVSESNG